MKTNRKTKLGTSAATKVQNRPTGSLVLAVAGLVISLGNASATTRYVDVNSSNPTKPYTNWVTAATSIQQAVDASQAGDTVLATNGVYAVGDRETFDSYGNSFGFSRVVVTNAIALRSVNGPQLTIIDGAWEVRCVSLRAGASLTGFTLTNGYAWDSGRGWNFGGGVFCTATNAFLTNCLVTGCRADDDGGGAYGGTLDHCTLSDNHATSGGGAWSSTFYNCTLAGNEAFGWGGGTAGGALYNCTVTGNRAADYGGGAYGGDLHNCTLTGNSAHESGGGAYDGWLYNCTVTGNWAENGVGGGAYYCSLYNCIVYFNTASTEPNFDTNSDLNYCCTTPLPPGGIGNIAPDPLLASASHLSTASPCRGAGSAAYASGTDIDGELWGSPPSIGCDEYHAGAVTGALTVSLTANYTNVSVGYPVAFTALIEGRTARSVWDFGDGVSLSNRPYASHTWAAPGDYAVVLRAFNETWPGGVSATVTVHVINSVNYVALHNPTPIPPYTSWATAATNIQDAVDAAVPGGLVLVTNGVYISYVEVHTPLTLRSVNGPEFTLIAGEDSYVYLDSGASLSGFTLTNGYGLNGGGTSVASNCVIIGSLAGGASGGTLYNCTLAGNSGCGAYGATLFNCILSGNSSSDNGGGACDCTLYNCALTGNSATYYGGGAYNCTLYNCTLTGNTAASYGGGADHCTLFNCIVYFNTAPSGSNFVDDADNILNYCCTTPLPESGTGNIGLDPQLASANRLSAASPCRGAGSAAYASGTDLDGEAWGNPPAIGCDEYHAGALTGPLTVSLLANHTNMTVGYPVDFTALIEGRTTASAWDFGDGVLVSNRPYASHAWAALGDHLVVLRAYNESHPGGVSATMTIHVVQEMHYVAALSANPQPPYTNWATAATSIQAAVAAVVLPGASVLVTNGVYAGSVAVTNSVAVRSVNGAQFTIIKGGNPCVSLAAGASLTGFTLTNAYRGVSCASTNAFLTNCVIVGNGGGNGGGANGGTLCGCTLAGNATVGSGGGAYGSILYNCVLSGNSGAGYWGWFAGQHIYVPGRGGGAYDCTLYNCTLSGNTADSGGGAYGGALYNCIVYFNTASNSANYYTSSALNYCCSTPLPTNGLGNLTNAPLFVDYAGGNLRLQSNSPCINSGNNGFVTTATDLDGNPRIVRGTVDIGAYEFQGSGSLISYAWLQHYNLPTSGSADYLDFDGDGHNNWQEWICGTDPASALSVLRMLPPVAAGGHLNVSWQSMAGVNYFLERAVSLRAPFTLLATNIIGEAVSTTYTDTNAASSAPLFYRVGDRRP